MISRSNCRGSARTSRGNHYFFSLDLVNVKSVLLLFVFYVLLLLLLSSCCCNRHIDGNSIVVVGAVDAFVVSGGIGGRNNYNKSVIRKTSSSLLHVSFFQDFFSGSGMKETKNKKQQKQKNAEEILELKQLLVTYCDQSKPDRKQIEMLMKQLAVLSPIQSTATSPLLQKKWICLWTTEKEINFFLNNNIANYVSQTIDGTKISNAIPFTKGGGGFYVDGILSIPNLDYDTDNNDNQQRTEFIFEKAVVDFGNNFIINLPPVGKGWFDTIYLDDDFRIDINSRNDILIAIPANDEDE